MQGLHIISTWVLLRKQCVGTPLETVKLECCPVKYKLSNKLMVHVFLLKLLFLRGLKYSKICISHNVIVSFIF